MRWHGVTVFPGTYANANLAGLGVVAGDPGAPGPVTTAVFW